MHFIELEHYTCEDEFIVHPYDNHMIFQLPSSWSKFNLELNFVKLDHIIENIKLPQSNARFCNKQGLNLSPNKHTKKVVNSIFETKYKHVQSAR